MKLIIYPFTYVYFVNRVKRKTHKSFVNNQYLLVTINKKLKYKKNNDNHHLAFTLNKNPHRSSKKAF